jgi:hypothetical protein
MQFLKMKRGEEVKIRRGKRASNSGHCLVKLKLVLQHAHRQESSLNNVPEHAAGWSRIIYINIFTYYLG